MQFTMSRTEIGEGSMETLHPLLPKTGGVMWECNMGGGENSFPTII